MCLPKKITISRRKDDVFAGWIEVKDGKLKYNTYEEDLEKYLKENIKKWEQQKFTYVGAMEGAGQDHFGHTKEKVGIDNSKFLVALWFYIDQNIKANVFDMKYIWHL
jgi:hypothetical protein